MTSNQNSVQYQTKSKISIGTCNNFGSTPQFPLLFLPYNYYSGIGFLIAYIFKNLNFVSLS